MLSNTINPTGKISYRLLKLANKGKNYALWILLTLFTASCATGQLASDTSSYVPALAQYDQGAVVRVKATVDDTVMYAGDAGVFSYSVEGLQKRPVLRNLATGKKLKGLDADRLMSELERIRVSSMSDSRIAGVCSGLRESCFFDQKSGNIFVFDNSSNLLETISLSSTALASSSSMRKILGDRLYARNANIQLLDAVSSSNRELEKTLLVELDKDTDYERLYLHKKSLRTSGDGNTGTKETALFNSLRGEVDIRHLATVEADPLQYLQNLSDTKREREERLEEQRLEEERQQQEKNEREKELRLAQSRSLGTYTGFIQAFEISGDFEDLKSAKQECQEAECTDLERRFLQFAQDENAKVLEVSSGAWGVEETGVKSADMGGGIIASADLTRGAISVPVSVALSDAYRSIGFTQPDSEYVVEVRLELNYVMTFKAFTRHGRMSDEPLNYKKNLNFVLNKENGFEKALTSEFDVILATRSSRFLMGETQGSIDRGSIKIKRVITSISLR